MQSTLNTNCQHPSHCQHEAELDNIQQVYGSYTTVGSTAYSIVRKIEALFSDFRNWFLSKLETITEQEVHDIWNN